MAEILVGPKNLRNLAVNRRFNGEPAGTVIAGCRIFDNIAFSDTKGGRHERALIKIAQVSTVGLQVRRNGDGKVYCVSPSEDAMSANPTEFDGFMVTVTNNGRLGIKGESTTYPMPPTGYALPTRRKTIEMLERIADTPDFDGNTESMKTVEIFDANPHDTFRPTRDKRISNNLFIRSEPNYSLLKPE